MLNKSKYQLIEKIIYLIIWLLAFSIPILFSIGNKNFNFNRLLHEWIRITPFFIAFIIHNYFVFRYFDKKKYQKYVIFTTLLILAISFFGSYIHLFIKIFHVPQANFPKPPHMGNPNHFPPPKPESGTQNFFNNFFNNIVITILVIGLNNAFKIAIKWLDEKRNYELLQTETLKNELDYLRHQISPHFLMNTLNNIHALIDYDTTIAKNSVVKLSKLMRVLLYETKTENFTLKKEIDFLNDYIELMRIRVNQNVEIKFEHPKQIPDIKIAPLLFISFVENAFKHGIKAIGKSFIHIKFLIEDNNLQVNITNSKIKNTNTKSERTKIGLNNSKKRLELIYKNNHTFEIIENENLFKVHIKIPLT